MIQITQREREAPERRELFDPNDGNDRELLRLDAAELFASTTWLGRAIPDETDPLQIAASSAHRRKLLYLQ